MPRSCQGLCGSVVSTGFPPVCIGFPTGFRVRVCAVVSTAHQFRCIAVLSAAGRTCDMRAPHQEACAITASPPSQPPTTAFKYVQQPWVLMMVFARLVPKSILVLQTKSRRTSPRVFCPLDPLSGRAAAPRTPGAPPHPYRGVWGSVHVQSGRFCQIRLRHQLSQQPVGPGEGLPSPG